VDSLGFATGVGLETLNANGKAINACLAKNYADIFPLKQCPDWLPMVISAIVRHVVSLRIKPSLHPETRSTIVSLSCSAYLKLCVRAAAN